MASLDTIKNNIKKLYETNPNIHINVCMTRPKVQLTNESVVIKEVYPHIFQITEQNGDFSKSYTIPYTDVLTNQIKILELADR